MRFTNIAMAAAASGVVSAEGRPNDTSICDYYTKALLKEVTAENEATLLTLLVNTVVIGNYTMPNVGVSVPGILAPGEVDGTKVELAPYFTGALESTNRGGDHGVSVNFLDGGGAAPLKENKPANDDSSNQYFLLNHLYQFFGTLLGCSKQGMTGFDAYQGDASMYEVHKFMDLNNAQVTYFIQQVGMAAASFGVAEADITAVAKSLSSIFGVRCGPPTAVVGDKAELQSICIDEDTCPKAEKPTCDKYDTPMMPKKNGTSSMTMSEDCPAGTKTSMAGTMMPTGTMMSTGTGMMPSGTDMPTGTQATTMPTAGAATNGFSIAAIAAGIAAFAL